MSVLVVTGVAREARIAAGPGIETLCSGGSPARLRALLAERPEPGVSAIISFGIAGGLDPALDTGAVVVASAIISDGDTWPTDMALGQGLLAALTAEGGLDAMHAPIAGVEIALVDAASKARIRARTNAVAVDMESHIAAEYAARHALPFAAIRIVCDPAGRGLPPLVAVALKPDGGVSLPAVIGSLLRQPGQIAGLLTLARDARTAFRVLGRIPARWTPALGKNGRYVP